MKLDAPVRRAVGALIKRAGYEVHRVPGRVDDEPLYQGYDPAVLLRRPFINVGAGKFSHRHWTNVDFDSEWYASQQPKGFVHYDLTALQPLPFETGSLELAYTSHTVEHVGDGAAANLFAECYRVLSPGGGLRITCPDAHMLWRSAKLDRLAYWRWRARWFSGPLSLRTSDQEVTIYDYLVREIATPRCRFYRGAQAPYRIEDVRERLEVLSYVEFMEWLVDGLEFRSQYPGDHINWWDEKKLQMMLRQAGFSEIYASRRGQSLYSPMTNMALFDTTQPSNSLYVEAVR